MSPAPAPPAPSTGAHCLAIPYPIHSHLTPLFNFSLTLASHGLPLTFVLPHRTLSRILRSRSTDPAHPQPLPLPPALQMVGVSDGLPPDFDENTDLERFHAAVGNMATSIEELVEKLNADGLPVTCVIGSPFLLWSQDVARKFNLPWVFFWTQSVTVFSMYYHFLTLGNALPGLEGVEETDVPQEDEVGLISCIPGIPPFKPQHLPSFLQANNTMEVVYEMFCKIFTSLDAADCIVVNSFYEAESEIMDAIKIKYPVYLIGPTLPYEILQGEHGHIPSTGVSLWREEGCFQWLDAHQKQSLLYISFGSLVDVPSVQFHEIAMALVSTGVHFLWVIRKPRNEDRTITELLPEGFLDLTKDQGRILSWVPQLEVLSHPAVGGFLSHAGWNSTLESITTGVPLLTLPQFSDQTTNANVIVNVWRIGVDLRKKDGVVCKEEIEKAIKKVMQEEEGMEMRSRAFELREKACRAIRDGGSSHAHIHAFIDAMKKKI